MNQYPPLPWLVCNRYQGLERCMNYVEGQRDMTTMGAKASGRRAYLHTKASSAAAALASVDVLRSVYGVKTELIEHAVGGGMIAC